MQNCVRVRIRSRLNMLCGRRHQRVWCAPGKEYALADSRYMSSDPFVLTMESCTAFVEGPLCLLVAYAIATRAPWRHPIQMTVSIGQFYGCVLYFATSEWSTVRAWVRGRVLACLAWLTIPCVALQVKYGPPGHPIYFWFYYVFMNAIWIVIPGYCIVQSICASTAAFAAQAKASASNKAK